MKGVQYAKWDDVKEANTMTTSNFVTLDHTKMIRRLYKKTLDTLQRIERMNVN